MDIEDESEAAGAAFERSLMRAVGAVETELSRVVRSGEADLERLAGAIADILARLGSAQPAPAASEAQNAGSINQIAAAVARAVRRGARFS